MTTIAPKKLILTCTVTGKTVTWTNQKIIQGKIDKFGSLEAFTAQYVSKGANKSEPKPKAQLIRSVCEQGIKLGKMSSEEYHTQYVTRHYPNKDGSITTVVAPAVPALATRA